MDNPRETLNQVLTKEQMNKPQFNKDMKNPMREHIKEKGPSIYIPDVVSFFQGVPIKQIECGLKNVFAVTESGELYSWGDNNFKQLAQSDPVKKKQKLSLNNLKERGRNKKDDNPPVQKPKDDSSLAQNGGRFLNKPKKIGMFEENGIIIK